MDLPGDLSLHAPLLEAASSILLVGPGASASLRASLKVWGYWEWLVANVAGPKLFACCSWEDYDASLSDLILQASDELAPIAVVQQSPVAARDGALFFLKFFTELELHSEGRITGRMAWFSWSKAKELLKRRRLPATFGLRA